MEIPRPSRSNHLDQTRDFVQGSRIVLLDEPVPVDRFRPGVFSTFVSLPIASFAPDNLNPQGKNSLTAAAGNSGGLKFPFLKYHLERVIANGIAAGVIAAGSGGPAEIRQLTQAVTEMLAAGQLRILPQILPGEQVICRIIATAGDLLPEQAQLALTIDKYSPKRPAGAPAALVSIEAKRDHPEVKSTDLDLCRAAAEFAQKSGADEALLISKDGTVREGAWSNLFWIDRENRIWTVKDRILPGIARRVLLELGLAAPAAAEITVEQLIRDAREVFFTQSTSGITPVGSIDGKAIGTGLPGPITGEVILRYQAALLNSIFPGGI